MSGIQQYAPGIHQRKSIVINRLDKLKHIPEKNAGMRDTPRALTNMNILSAAIHKKTISLKGYVHSKEPNFKIQLSVEK